MILNGAGELANLTEALVKTYKKVPECVSVGVLPWGVLASSQAQKLVSKNFLRSKLSKFL